jgi:hypothetical protein
MENKIMSLEELELVKRHLCQDPENQSLRVKQHKLRERLGLNGRRTKLRKGELIDHKKIPNGTILITNFAPVESYVVNSDREELWKLLRKAGITGGTVVYCNSSIVADSVLEGYKNCLSTKNPERYFGRLRHLEDQDVTVI